MTELSAEKETISTSSAGKKQISASMIKTMLNNTLVSGFTRIYRISALAFRFFVSVIALMASFPQNRPDSGSILLMIRLAIMMVTQPHTDCMSAAAEERLMFGRSSSAL